MYELKTKPTEIDPLDVIFAIPHEKKQADARILLTIFEKTTGEQPVVWGEKQIGFGRYRYKYPTGHVGEAYRAGFVVTKTRITLHLNMEEAVLSNYLQRLGKAAAGKSCIYVNKLSDIDVNVLVEMIGAAEKFIRDTFPDDAQTRVHKRKGERRCLNREYIR